MRKKLWSVTLAALAVAVVLTFGACSQGGPVDTGSTYMPAKMIEGVISEEGTGDPPLMPAYVAWYVDYPPGTGIGSEWDANDGSYEIWGDTVIWAAYEDEDLAGFVEVCIGYVVPEGPEWITDFDLGEIPYEVNFELEPE